MFYQESKGIKLLTEAGIGCDHFMVRSLTEAQQLELTDDTLVEMFKLISDKYNSIDFREIEVSKGDVTKFKYLATIEANVETLESIYMNAEEEGAKKYLGVISNIKTVLKQLRDLKDSYVELWKADNALVQVLYTSCLTSIIYAITTLISNTIRFVTSEQDTSYEVLFDEVPNSIKHVHFRNLEMLATDDERVRACVMGIKNSKSTAVNESVSGSIATTLVVGTLIMNIPRIIYIIREIIYTTYCVRIRLSDALAMESMLIQTNIESLNRNKGKNKKIIARQRKIADKLMAWSKKIAINVDTVEQKAQAEVTKDVKQVQAKTKAPTYTDPLIDYNSTSDVYI